MTPRDERLHAKLYGARESLAVAVLGLSGGRGVAMSCDLGEEAEPPAFEAALTVLTRQGERLANQRMRLVELSIAREGLAEIDHAIWRPSAVHRLESVACRSEDGDGFREAPHERVDAAQRHGKGRYKHGEVPLVRQLEATLEQTGGTAQVALGSVQEPEAVAGHGQGIWVIEFLG